VTGTHARVHATPFAQTDFHRRTCAAVSSGSVSSSSSGSEGCSGSPSPPPPLPPPGGTSSPPPSDADACSSDDLAEHTVEVRTLRLRKQRRSACCEAAGRENTMRAVVGTLTVRGAAPRRSMAPAGACMGVQESCEGPARSEWTRLCFFVPAVNCNVDGCLCTATSLPAL
jgi:hypothetical protein